MADRAEADVVSRARFAERARAFDHLFDAVVVTDMTGTITDWNAGAARLYGYEAGEMLGQPVSVLHAPEDVDRVTAEVFASIDRQGHWTGEIRMRRKDQSIGWIESFVIPLLDDAGVPLGALGVNRDISARKRAEQALRESEARWRALLEVSPDAVVVSDKTGRIELVNARAESLFGYGRDELLGRPVEVLLPERLRELHQAHRTSFVTAPRLRSMEDREDLVGRRRDGLEIPLKIGLSMLEQADGMWMVAILHDLTAQRAMLERMRLLGAALAAAANGIAISDPSGVCQWVNPGFTRITGYAPDEIVGQRLSRLKSGVHDAAFFEELWATIQSGRPWQGEITNRHKLGHLYVEEQTISPVSDERGRITHYVAVKQDVSARKQMEAKLREANDSLQRHLVAIEALQVQLHEQAVRDPLTGLHNRRFLAEALEREIARAGRDDRPLAAVIVDLDQFKQINDRYGHGAGDATLCAAAKILTSLTRSIDIVCRYGGEEFMVLLPGAGLATAVGRAESWRAAFADLATDVGGVAIRATFSAGVAVHSAHGGSGESLLRAADEALYRAKQSGRNRVVPYTHADDAGDVVHRESLRLADPIEEGRGAVDQHQSHDSIAVEPGE